MKKLKYRIKNEDFNKLIYLAVSLWENVGFKINTNEITFSWIEEDTCYGCTTFNPKQFGYIIAFNPGLTVDGCQDLLLNTAVHELGHYIQLAKAINDKILIRTENDIVAADPTSEAHLYVLGNEEEKGHSRFWKDICSKVNSLDYLRYPIACAGGPMERKVFLQANKDNFNFKIKCLDCSFVDYFMFMNDILAAIMFDKMFGLPKFTRIGCPECKSPRLDVEIINDEGDIN